MNIFEWLGFSSKKAPPVELEHINQEMYKKSVELKERNETLSLLHKIDEIILSDITHLNDIAQKVASLLISDIDFQLVSLFLYDKKNNELARIALETSPIVASVPLSYLSKISFSAVDNMLIQAVTERSIQFSSTLAGVLLPKTQDPIVIDIKSIFIYPLIVRGNVLGVIVVCMREAQEEVSQFRKDLLSRLVDVIGIALDSSILYNEVQAANERLKELDKLKDEFVSVASHELRTPMTAIKSYLWMAVSGRGGELTEKQKYYLERAYSSTDRLIKLVNDMLNISRIESGRITLDMKPIDIVTLTRDIVEEVLPRAREVGVTVTVTDSAPLPQVLADSDKIKEVLINLIGNSLKFTPPDGAITVSFINSEDMVEVHIKDTGVGIEAGDLPKLFQKFEMIEGSYVMNKNASGTGLGLYICKSIIELHGCTIKAQSEGRGKGSEFVFTLKVAG